MLQGHDPPGSLVGVTLGNYRVTERIGAGGMGVVYRAQDLRLGRSVAVKALPESADYDPAARRKLMDEARHGSSVVSPYVATVFDVVEQDDRAYIVMEHIEGRRLDDVLREDRPDLKRVTGYAVEIAEALTAIHAAGLVHRDLKPGNVMVTPAGHVKVMDFGLARENAAALLREVGSLSTETTHTSPGHVAGTVLYMSPEQLRDEPLDARSDLFSFGTLLHEAVTGVHPFERATILASASAILHEPPTGSGVAPGIVPPPIAPIVGRLLEKDRDRRYSSAELLLSDLRTVQAGQIVAPQPAPVPKPFVNRAIVTAVLGIVAIAFAGYRFWPSKPGAPGRPVVAVLPFEDRTGEPRGDLFARLLADLIASNLAESSLVRALPEERIQEILRGLGPQAPESRTLAAVTKAADPRWIIAGSLYKEGDASYAMVKVFLSGKSEPSDSFRVNGGSASALAELASAKLQEQLFPDRKDAVSAGSGTAVGGSTSEEAQLLEHEGKRALHEFRYRDAIDKLEQATKLDPEFLAAQARYADALDRSGYARQAGETADRAARIVERLGDAARGETVVLEARAVIARIRGKTDDELEARRDLVARHGDDPRARIALANALAVRGKTTDALLEANMASELDPKDPNAYLLKSGLLAGAQRFDEASAELDRAQSLIKETGSAIGQAKIDRARGYSGYMNKKYPQSAALYERAAREFEAAGFGALAAQCLKGVGDCELMQGHLDAAVSFYDRVLAAARSVGDFKTIVNTLASVGGNYLVRGNCKEAERALRQAREDGLKLGNPLLLMLPTLNLASALDCLGRDDEARPFLEEVIVAAREAGDAEMQSKALLLLANSYYGEGHLEEAIRSYREVSDSRALARASGNPVGNAHLGLARILRETGHLKLAYESAEAAVAANREANDRPGLVYALIQRAHIRAELGLDPGADEDLAEAAKIVSDRDAPLAALGLRVSLGRASVDVLRSQWGAAERELAALRNAPESARSEGFDASVAGLSAQTMAGLGRWKDSLRSAKTVVECRAASPVERARARVDLSRAYLGTADRGAARAEAQDGIADAERLGLPYVTALGLALLVDLAGGDDVQSLRAQGREALERYLDAAPANRTGVLRARKDIQVMIRAFEVRAR